MLKIQPHPQHVFPAGIEARAEPRVPLTAAIVIAVEVAPFSVDLLEQDHYRI